MPATIDVITHTHDDQIKALAALKAKGEKGQVCFVSSTADLDLLVQKALDSMKDNTTITHTILICAASSTAWTDKVVDASKWLTQLVKDVNEAHGVFVLFVSTREYVALLNQTTDQETRTEIV